MIANVRLFPEATREYIHSIAWYEDRRRGLGLRFSKAVQKVFDRLKQMPLRWPEVLVGVHQAPVPRWPFVVIYHIDGTIIDILAIFHTSRDPQEWMGRV